MIYSSLTLQELQKRGLNHDVKAILELGRRVLQFDFCNADNDHYMYCSHKFDLEELQGILDNEIPPECPKCGTWLTDK